MSKFGAETTTDEVLAEQDLTGKTAVVTGAASGLGQETVRAFCSKGARVVLPVRDLAKGKAAAEQIYTTLPDADLEVMHCDLASLRSVRAFADLFLSKHKRVDLLINNAGVMASPLMRTEDGFEMQFGVCHLGHFLLTNLLMSSLLTGMPSRIVNLSSRGHQRSSIDFNDPNFEHRAYDKWLAYGQAKTANILFTVELERRLGHQNVHAFAVHPGVIRTQLGRHLSDQDIEDMRADMASRGATNTKLKSIAQGAATTVFAAVSPELAGRGGTYLEDCDVAAVSDDISVPDGVRSYALDEKAARQLWDLSEELVGQSFS